MTRQLQSARQKSHPVAGLVNFTIIELLVLIMIILLLMVLLMPSLQRTIETANRVTCANNQKQSAAAVFVYVDDNRGFLPLVYASYALHDAYREGLPGGLVREQSLGMLWMRMVGGSGDFSKIVHNQYTTKEITLCPSVNIQFSFCVPRTRRNGPSFPEQTPTQWRMPTPHDEYAFGSSYLQWRVMAACFTRTNPKAAPHRNLGTNVLYMDGSSHWSNNPDAPMWLGYTWSPRTNWCNGYLNDQFWKRVNAVNQ